VLNKTCARFEQNGKSATAFFSDGTSVESNLLIGADGLRSVVRAQIHGDAKPRYAGFSVLRCLVEAHENDPPLPRGVCRIFWGVGQSLGTYHVGDGVVYVFGWRKAPEGVHVPRGERRQEWLARYRDWSPEIPKLLERMPDESEIYQTDIYDRPPVERWGEGAVSLVGDAAHPMTFNMGQGACQGLEDVAVLWRTIPAHGEVPAALRAYEDERRERIKTFTTQSARIADVSVLDHPLGWRVRNLLFRLFGRGAARGQKALQIEV
jgi:2-polyprenyl-6-methoxyphenol hydroxylase-like FAD-dependent oxidoreductase